MDKKEFLATKELSLVNSFGVFHKVTENQKITLTEQGSVILLETPIRFAKIGEVLMSVQIGKCELEKHLENGDLVEIETETETEAEETE